MEVNVGTLGATLLSGAISLLSLSIPAATYVARKFPRRKEADMSTVVAVLRTELAHVKLDIAELKDDVRYIRQQHTPKRQ